MFHFVFFILLSSASIRFVDGLICANDCDFAGNISSVTLPACAVVDKPVTEQSCQVILIIDYISGRFTGRINPKTPPTVGNFDAMTDFSLFSEASYLEIEYDCVDSDKCDISFINNVLNSDWIKVQSQVKNLRSILADMLFNSSDLRPQDTCPSSQPCSGEGFCTMAYQVWSDASSPVVESTCTNSTEKPLLKWIQAYDEKKIGEVMLYTCNEPSCATVSIAETIFRILQRDYVLPFNVVIPSTTTTTTTTTTAFVSTMSTTTPIPSTTKNAADSNFFDTTGKMIFSFASFFFLYLF